MPEGYGRPPFTDMSNTHSSVPSLRPRLDTGNVIGNRYYVQAIRARGGSYELVDGFDTLTGASSILKVVRRAPATRALVDHDLISLRNMIHKSEGSLQRYLRSHKIGPEIVLVFEKTGRSLRSVLVDPTYAPLSKRYIQEIALQIIHGTEYLHGLGLVHASLSPDSVWFDSDEEVNLLHYCKRSKSHIYLKSMKSTSLRIGYYGQVGNEKSNAYLNGIDQYRSPEMLAGRRTVPQNDHFSIGCITFELTQGRPIFPECFSQGALYIHEKLWMMQEVFGPLSTSLTDHLSVRSPIKELVVNHCLVALSPTDTSASVRRFLSQPCRLNERVEDTDILHAIRRLCDLDYRTRPSLTEVTESFTFFCDIIF